METSQRNNCISTISVVALATLLAIQAPAAEHKATFTAGQKAPVFQVKTTDGKTVKFPETYKGKVVLLDFWATWCGPCRAELPGLSAAYQKFHPDGLEVLGISLDREGAGSKLAKFTKENNMPWPQVYDGKYWKAAQAVQYDIHSIPQPVLVDGDTGLILAEGPAVRGQRLGPAIERALAAVKAKKKE